MASTHDRDAFPSDSTSYASSLSSRKSSRFGRVRTAVRALAFVSSVASALCAGSITVFSLYGHIFQERLHYSQFQVNGVAIGAAIALYLPVSVLGYVCDRVGTAPLSFLASVLLGGGYGLAAGIYRHSGDGYTKPEGHKRAKDAGWSYPLMVFAFVCIGTGTCAMYLSAVATCAKNFGKGSHRGLALAMPIAGFGLSGMWLSQVGSRWCCEKLADGTCGDVDVFRFFVFLAVLLFVVGLVGIFTLRVVDEEDIIDGAAEELERSGLLDAGSVRSGHMNRGYHSITGSRQLEGEDEDDVELEGDSRWKKWKKNWVLNAETKQFLSDRTMWCFALGFLLMIGPGEAFINNLGTIIGTLTSSPATATTSGSQTTAATHVSIVGVASTVARLLTGSLTDLLAPSPHTQHAQFSAHQTMPLRDRVSVSRVTFLLVFAAILSSGLVVLASGAVQNHTERFWIVSGTVGAGYGAVFSLTPIVIAIIWGVENFATNWGIVAMFPALGSTVWGLLYSAVYEMGTDRPPAGGDGGADDDIFCYGMHCYAPTFWAMAVTVWIACAFVLYAWKGRGGWSQRGIVI